MPFFFCCLKKRQNRKTNRRKVPVVKIRFWSLGAQKVLGMAHLTVISAFMLFIFLFMGCRVFLSFCFSLVFPSSFSFLSFFVIYSSNFSLLALVSVLKKCFLRSRCSMEMWCPDDIRWDSWDWVGPPAWWRACFNSPEWGGASSPLKTEPLQIVLLLFLLLLRLLFRTRVTVCMSTAVNIDAMSR